MLTNARGVFSITFFVVFLALLAQLGLVFSPFLPTILWAIILARLFYPLYRKALRLTGGREAVSAGLLTFTVMGAAVIPAIYIGVLAVQESVDAYRAVTSWADAGGLKDMGESLSRLPLIGRVSQQLAGRVIVAQGDVELSIVEASKRLSTFLVTQAGQLAQDALLLATDFLVMLFTLFFLFKDGHRLFARLYAAIPLEAAHKDRIFERLNGAVAAVVRGTLLTALAQGAIAGTTYALLDLPYAVFLGALSALVALAPFGGTALVWGPLALYLFATGFVMEAVVLMAVGAGLISLMDNVFYYWITGNAARLPVLFLFFASLGGVAYYGFVGLFLGPILLAVVMAAFQIYEEDYQPSPATRIVMPEDTRQT